MFRENVIFPLLNNFQKLKLPYWSYILTCARVFGMQIRVSLNPYNHYYLQKPHLCKRARKYRTRKPTIIARNCFGRVFKTSIPFRIDPCPYFGGKHLYSLADTLFAYSIFIFFFVGPHIGFWPKRPSDTIFQTLRFPFFHFPSCHRPNLLLVVNSLQRAFNSSPLALKGFDLCIRVSQLNFFRHIDNLEVPDRDHHHKSIFMLLIYMNF